MQKTELIEKIEGYIFTFEDVKKNYSQFFKDKDVVTSLLEQDGRNLEYFSNYNNNKGMVKVALGNNLQAFSYINETLQKDFKFLLEIIKIAPSLVTQISPNYLEEKSSLYQIIETSPYTFRYFNLKIRSNKDVIDYVTDIRHRFQFTSLPEAIIKDTIFLTKIINKVLSRKNVFIVPNEVIYILDNNQDFNKSLNRLYPNHLNNPNLNIEKNIGITSVQLLYNLSLDIEAQEMKKIMNTDLKSGKKIKF
jgi:hypothetical protein